MPTNPERQASSANKRKEAHNHRQSERNRKGSPDTPLMDKRQLPILSRVSSQASKIERKREMRSRSQGWLSAWVLMIAVAAGLCQLQCCEGAQELQFGALHWEQ
eukprot:1284010-Rhodomonas_salina.2